MFSAIFEQFVEASPLRVMVRAIMERIFAPEKLDDLFEQTAEKQLPETVECGRNVPSDYRCFCL